MGIDIEKKRKRVKKMRTATTTNNYHQLLLKLYKFLDRRTDSKFNTAVHKRLAMSRVNRFPVSLSRLVKYANTEDKRNKILVVAGPVLDDERLLEVPKLRVCALKFSQTARARIEKANGECLTYDQLAKVAPLGQNTLLLRGPRRREAFTHFRGLHGKHAKPYIANNNHKGKERNTYHKW